MISSMLVLALLGWRSFPCSGLPGVTQNTAAQTGPRQPAWSPRPTQAPALAQKRDIAGNRTCGFVDGENVSPLTCDNALQQCVVDETAAVAGCCGTTMGDQSSSYFVECGFYTGCNDYVDSNHPRDLSGPTTSAISSDLAAVSGASMSLSPPVQLVLSCFAAAPLCATYPFTYNGLTLSIVGCHSNIGHFSLQPLPYLPTYRQLSETILPSPTSSSSSPLTSTTSHSVTMSRKELVEIVAPSVLGGVAIAACLISWFLLRRKIRQHVSKTQDPDGYQADHLSFFPRQVGLSTQEWKSSYLTSTSRETEFLAFLSSYGPGGVPLRELIMLGSLRLSGERSKNHWLENGEVGSFQNSMHDISSETQNHSFLDDFMKATSNSRQIEYFQDRLKSLGLIDVMYPEGARLNRESQYWHTDQRIWILREDQCSGPPEHTNDPTVIQIFLDVFLEMPDKDVSPAAQRQREVYYHHAHLLIHRVMRFRERVINDRLSFLQLVFVILQLLTHRYQEGDAVLLEFVQDSSKSYIHPRIMDLMLLWAELKETGFREDYAGLCSVRDRLPDLITSYEASSCATPRQNGLLGFLLIDLMNTAKEAHFEDIISDAVKAGTEWVARAHMESTLERMALCEALATFDIHDREDAILQENRLFYGYHLSRAGFLVKGDRLLASGLEPLDSVDNHCKHLSYQIERVSIALRLGRQKEAAQMLASIRCIALYNRDDGDYSDGWKKSGECAEVFVLLYLYEADCSASAGRLDDACAKLKSGIIITSSMHDAYIQALHVTLEMRLLEVHMWQQHLKEALDVALKLAEELFDQQTRSNFTSFTIYAILLRFLDLCNTLLSAGDAIASLRLLEHVTSIRAYLPALLSEDLKWYAQQRMATVRNSREENELLRHKSNTRALDTSIEDSITQIPMSSTPLMPTTQARTDQGDDFGLTPISHSSAKAFGD